MLKHIQITKWEIVIFCTIILFYKVTIATEIQNTNNNSSISHQPSQIVKKQSSEISNGGSVVNNNNLNLNQNSNNPNIPAESVHHEKSQQLLPTNAQSGSSSTSSSKVEKTDNKENNYYNTKALKDLEIPDSYRIGFYIFIGLGVLAVLFFSCRSYRLRLSRAERRYGVHGDRRAQELTPLPMSVEDDSDTEDHTVFDINKQLRISS